MAASKTSESIEGMMTHMRSEDEHVYAYNLQVEPFESPWAGQSIQDWLSVRQYHTPDKARVHITYEILDPASPHRNGGSDPSQALI